MTYATTKKPDSAANAIYLSGGQTAGTNLYYKFTNTANKARQANLPISLTVINPDITTAADADELSDTYLNVGADIAIEDNLVIASDRDSTDGYPRCSI